MIITDEPLKKQDTVEKRAKDAVCLLYDAICDSNEAGIGPINISFTATGQIVIQYDNGHVSFWDRATPIS